MPLKIKQNGQIYSPYSDYNEPFTAHSLCFKSNGRIRYVPLCSPNQRVPFSESKSLTYNPYKYPKIKVRVDGQTLYAINSVWSDYSIPAGTYSPKDFYNLISQFVSGSRTVANAFTATVNGQTINIGQGNTIYLYTIGTSPWNARFVGFNASYNQAPYLGYNGSRPNDGFGTYKQYCVGGMSDTATGYGQYYKNYQNYPITIGVGINFN